MLVLGSGMGVVPLLALKAGATHVTVIDRRGGSAVRAAGAPNHRQRFAFNPSMLAHPPARLPALLRTPHCAPGLCVAAARAGGCTWRPRAAICWSTTARTPLPTGSSTRGPRTCTRQRTCPSAATCLWRAACWMTVGHRGGGGHVGLRAGGQVSGLGKGCAAAAVGEGRAAPHCSLMQLGSCNGPGPLYCPSRVLQLQLPLHPHPPLQAC